MSEPRLKVTDRRLFTAEGELREEFRHLEDAPAKQPETPPAPPAAEPPHRAETEAAAPGPQRPAALPSVPGYPTDDPQGPAFLDLLGMIAEPASIYLQKASMASTGDLRAASEQDQNLQLARLHIDLLGILREATAGNLDPQQQAMIDDVVMQLRRGYVQVKGL